MHLGWAAHRLGFRARTPVFDGAQWSEIEQCLAQAWLMERAGGLPVEVLPEDDVHRPDWDRVRRWCGSAGYSFDALFSEDALQGTEPGSVCLKLWLQQNGLEYDEDASFDELRRQVVAMDWERNLSAPTIGKHVLRDGRTGEDLGRPVMVGYKYMLKLGHMVSDKMHARSTGTYAAITQQPLKGKGAGGGQRIGEMEVWALEAHSAAFILREMLTVKSDDIEGRAEVLEAIMAWGTGESTRRTPNTPDSFYLLCSELRSLGLNPEFMQDDEEIAFLDEGPSGVNEIIRTVEDSHASQVGN